MKKARGFTLLELILVCLVIGTLAAIVAPSFVGVQGRSRLDQTARALVALGRAARSRASSDGRAYFLVVDPIARQVKLARQRDPLAAPTVDGDAETDGDDWTGGSAWARALPFEDGVKLVAASVAGQAVDVTSDSALIRVGFGSDGTADDSWFDFQLGDDGPTVRVVVEFASARTRILQDDERDAAMAGAPPPLPTAAVTGQ